MSAEPTELWPWLALVGLGFFHCINPTMGWLFAVAMGLHRRSFRTVLLSLVPIAIGHATAIALVLVAALALGLVFDHVIAGRVAAIILIGWALWHAVRGHRQRLRVGMQTGLRMDRARPPTVPLDQLRSRLDRGVESRSRAVVARLKGGRT